jgi:hypothetical protein
MDGERVDKSEYKNVVQSEKKRLLIQVVVLTALSAVVAITFLSVLLAVPNDVSTPTTTV